MRQGAQRRQIWERETKAHYGWHQASNIQEPYTTAAEAVRGAALTLAAKHKDGSVYQTARPQHHRPSQELLQQWLQEMQHQLQGQH